MTDQFLCILCHYEPVRAPQMVCTGCRLEHMERMEREIHESRKHWVRSEVEVPLTCLSRKMKLVIDHIVEKLKGDTHG